MYFSFSLLAFVCGDDPSTIDPDVELWLQFGVDMLDLSVRVGLFMWPMILAKDIFFRILRA